MVMGAIHIMLLNLNVNLSIKCDILNVRVFTSKLSALLFCSLPLKLRLNVVLNSVINELILSFRLHHSRSLWAHHLNCSMNVNLAVESFAIDLVENHVYHNECTSSSDAGRAMNANWTLRRQGSVSLKDNQQGDWDLITYRIDSITH